MIEKYWYQTKVHPYLLPLLPVTWLFSAVTKIRSILYRYGYKKSYRLPIPVIVVGNISVGGTGKTPVVIYLANLLSSQGYKVGIALRGYGNKKHHIPQLVTKNSLPAECGDESVVLAQNTACPVVICVDRVAAAKTLHNLSCNIIICDDGLQHYRLDRQVEIAIVDGTRYFGNQLLLPSGPLREPINRLKSVNFILINQRPPTQSISQLRNINRNIYDFHFKPLHFVSVANPQEKLNLDCFVGQQVHAVAGIGNPERFFASLRNLKINIIPHVFPDHYLYQKNDLNFEDELAIIMTEKDAIKCYTYNNLTKKIWYMKVDLIMDPTFTNQLVSIVENYL